MFGYARLHSSILRRVMSQRHYTKVIGALVEGEVLDPLAPYCAGIKSRGYRLSTKSTAQHCKHVPAEDLRSIERILRELKRIRQEQRTRWLPIHEHLDRIQRESTIVSSADAILAGLRPEARLCQQVLVEDIRQGVFKFSVSITGRCFNALTGLKRSLRAAVRLCGEPIGGVDIRCAQPALLAILLRGEPKVKMSPHIYRLRPVVCCCESLLLSLPPSPPSVPSRELRLLEELVVEGDLYQELVRLCLSSGVMLPGGPDDRREAAKKLLLRDVLAKRRQLPVSI